MNLPSYEFLSAPLWVVTLLHVVTLTLHLAAMGALFGGLGALLLLRAPDKRGHTRVQDLVHLLPTLMSFTVTLGVAPLLFLQLVYHRQVYAATIVSAWYWLGVVVAVIVAYYLFYSITLGRGGGGSSSAWRLLVAFLLLLYVSLVLSSVFTLAETPPALASAWAGDASGGVLNPDLGRWVPRWLHMVAGALTLGFFVLAIFVRDDAKLFAAAKAGTLWAAVAAILLGGGALAGLGEHLIPYMHSTAAWWLLASLLFTLGALHLLFRGQLLASGALFFVALAAMVMQRQIARLVVLGKAFDPGVIAVRPQWGVFALFLVCFVAMLGTVAWMLRLFFGGAKSVREA